MRELITVAIISIVLTCFVIWRIKHLVEHECPKCKGEGWDEDGKFCQKCQGEGIVKNKKA